MDMAVGDRNPRNRKTIRHRHHERRPEHLATTLQEVDLGIKGPKKEEEDFLRSVEVGDIPTVRKLLARETDLDVNCTDILGRTPLRLAVENEHLDIVELLLDRTEPKKLYEALLLAISLDHDEIAEVILKHPIYEKLEKQEEIYSNSNFYLSLVSEDSQFTAETTPLILAAQRNRFEIVSLLIRRGQRIDKPHEYSCKCHHCKAKVALDELRYAKSRLNAYKGLSSEAYISLSSDDPVLTAFQLGQELRHVAAREKHYRGEYEGLAKKLSEYVVKLIDHVRGNDELDIILNEGVEGHGMDNYGKLTRLKLALKFNEKQFVAHPSCQKKLTSIWYGEVQAFQRLPKLLIPLSILLLTSVFPVLAVIYWLAPRSKFISKLWGTQGPFQRFQVGAFLRTPFIKFVLNSVAFLVFLALIVTFSFTEKPSAGSTQHTKEELGLHNFHRFFQEFRHNLSSPYKNFHRLYLREFRPGIYQLLICLWIVGLLWQECKQLYSEGPQGYISSLFNLIDFTSLKIYIASFTLRYLSFYKTWESLRYFNKRESWLKLTWLDSEASYRAYWLIADRFYWDSWDPMNICEGLFAVANVLSFSRLFYLLAANEQLGPLQISLRRMISGDIMKFMVIFFIVFLAFLVGLNNLYWYYEPAVREAVQLYDHDHDAIMSNAERAFGTIEFTFRTVYWALFGMGDPTVVELGQSYQSAFTERIGYIVYGAYNFAAVIVLLNMLIAMMSRSFDSIQNDENVEWKFARAQLYMDFIQEGGTLPPPLNIIPSPKSIFRLFTPIVTCIKCIFCRGKKKKPKRGVARTKFQRHRDMAESYNMHNMEYAALNHSPGSTNQQLLPFSDAPYGHPKQRGGDGRSPERKGRIPPPRHGLEATDEETEEDLLELEHQENTPVGRSLPSALPAHPSTSGDIARGVSFSRATASSPPVATGGATNGGRSAPGCGPGPPGLPGPPGPPRPPGPPGGAHGEGEEVKRTPTYQSVIKSVVKRYIFESQKDDSSPIEGEIEELKQDLSSFRFEVLNNLQTQQKALQEAINMVGAKLDLYTSGRLSADLYSQSHAFGPSPTHSDYERSPILGQRYLDPRRMQCDGQPGPSPSHLPTGRGQREAPVPELYGQEFRRDPVEGDIKEDEIVPEQIIPVHAEYSYANVPSTGAATIGVSFSTTSDAQGPGTMFRRDKRSSLRGEGASPRAPGGDDSSQPGSATPKSPHSPSVSTGGSQDWEPRYLAGYKQDIDHFINLLESSSSTS